MGTRRRSLDRPKIKYLTFEFVFHFLLKKPFLSLSLAPPRKVSSDVGAWPGGEGRVRAQNDLFSVGWLNFSSTQRFVIYRTLGCRSKEQRKFIGEYSHRWPLQSIFMQSRCIKKLIDFQSSFLFWREGWLIKLRSRATRAFLNCCCHLQTALLNESLDYCALHSDRVICSLLVLREKRFTHHDDRRLFHLLNALFTFLFCVQKESAKRFTTRESEPFKPFFSSTFSHFHGRVKSQKELRSHETYHNVFESL